MFQRSIRSLDPFQHSHWKNIGISFAGCAKKSPPSKRIRVMIKYSSKRNKNTANLIQPMLFIHYSAV